MDEVRKADIVVLLFDESLNSKTQTCEMDVIVRYWDKDLELVKSRYLGSSFLGHARAKDLLEHLSKLTEEISSSEVFQVAMDSPSVNHNFLGGAGF